MNTHNRNGSANGRVTARFKPRTSGFIRISMVSPIFVLDGIAEIGRIVSGPEMVSTEDQNSIRAQRGSARSIRARDSRQRQSHPPTSGPEGRVGHSAGEIALMVSCRV